MSAPLPLVLLPGRMATRTAWRHQIAAFGAYRQVIVPDVHYRLDSIAAMADAIARVLPPRFDLAAWSMGGYIFWELWPLVTHRLNRLVLVATSARPEADDARRDRLKALALAERIGLPEAERQGIRRAIHDPAALPTGMLEAMNAASAALGIATLRSQVAAIIARRDHRAALARIDCPALVVVGDRDVVTPPSRAQEIAAAMPRATLRVMPGIGHCPPFEAAAAFNALMGGFLDAPVPVGDGRNAPAAGPTGQISLARDT